MKIDSHKIEFSSLRSYQEKTERVEELRIGTRRPDSLRGLKNPLQEEVLSYRLNISDRAQSAYRSSLERLSEKMASIDNFKEVAIREIEESIDSRFLLIKRMLEYYTGKEIKIGDFKSFNTDLRDGLNKLQSQDTGLQYNLYQSYYESEETSFSAKGLVKTADGKEISFSLDLHMSREYFEEESFALLSGASLVDPLVINYAGNAVELSDARFDFDLDMDGKKESLPQLASGSGFLVFDRNKDGIVNDGSELFGPKTGRAFEELAAYDNDKNNWIDENDEIYQDLYIWRHENGEDFLIDLKTAGIGAIYLGSEETEFALKNDKNELLAKVQRSGIYLKENGGVGSVQQIDFAL